MPTQPHWTFGASTLRRIVEQEAPILSPFELFGDRTQELHENRSWLVPRFQDATSGNLIISIQSFLIRQHRLNILVDTCGAMTNIAHVQTSNAADCRGLRLWLQRV
jgi:hypothetical protein